MKLCCEKLGKMATKIIQQFSAFAHCAVIVCLVFQIGRGQMSMRGNRVFLEDMCRGQRTTRVNRVFLEDMCRGQMTTRGSRVFLEDRGG